MLYFTQPDLLYIAVPKTGSSSVYTSYIKHASYASTNSGMTPHISFSVGNAILKPKTSIAVIREPIGWITSLYAHFQHDFHIGTWADTTNISLSSFCSSYLNGWRHQEIQCSTQSDLLIDTNGNIPDMLFPMEAIDELYHTINTILGVDESVNHLNVRPNTIQPVISPVLIDELLDFFHTDLKLYNDAKAKYK